MNWGEKKEEGGMVKIAIDRLRFVHIIPPNKYTDEDEYAQYDGSESRRKVRVLPETTAPNGPPSCKSKRQFDSSVVR